jgi:small subunit ribosomal protein S16
LHNGAQPTDTASYSFLHKGFIETSPWWWYRKGALTQEQADAKLAAWLEAKNGTVDAKKRWFNKSDGC